MKRSRPVIRLVTMWLVLTAWAAVAAAQTLDTTNAPARRRSVSLEGAGESDRPLPLWLLERAYLRAPDDMNRVHGFIRGQVLARTNLTAPVTPRPLPKSIPSQFRFITEAPKFQDTSTNVPAATLLEDLDFLEVVLANVYSYADRRGADWRGALDALRASVGPGLPADTFSLRLRRFLTLFGDPHTALRAPGPRDAPAGTAAFLTVADGARVLALKPDRSAFLNDECQYLTAIDGVPLPEWLRVAGDDIPKASPQWTRRATVEVLPGVDYLRTALGLPRTNRVALTLTSAAGAKTMQLVVSVTNRPPPRLPRHYGKTRVLNGDIGYLRLDSMSDEPRFLDQLDEDMKAFRGTRGLIIDVRGNSGGSQGALRTLFPYFLEPDAPMTIINVAAYRLPVNLPQPCAEGYLPYGRFLHPATSQVWSPEQRQQITAFLARFKPEWNLPPGKFSPWHVMGISSSTNPKAYAYTKPVVLLCDAGCFSATDNFLGAFQGRTNVTLLGTASGGGSGRMTSYTLPKTHLPLTICQMASFRSNGDLFDGRGVAPDVIVEAKPTDHLANGTDTVLAAGLERLNPTAQQRN